MKKTLLLIIAAMFALGASQTAQAADIHVSGGGTGKIYEAIRDNWATGGTIILDDSLTYTETTPTLYVGPRNSDTLGRRSFSIQTPAGQSPAIVLSGCRMVMYAGSADLQIGDKDGGKITIDATAAPTAAIWYIGQENGATGTACQATLENLDIDFGTVVEGIVFGAGGNDASPVMTGAHLTINNVKVTGGVVGVRALYGPASAATTVDINECVFINTLGVSLELGQFGLGGPNSVMNVNRSVMYVSPTVPAADLNCAVGYLGQMNIWHCDIINEGPTAIASRGVTAVGANIAVADSIICADAGTINFAAGSCSVAASNVTATTIPNMGFSYLSWISEWPVYVAYGADPSVANWFVVADGTQSKTFGASPPLGSKGGVILNNAPHWELIN